jgi:hypothetical protein
VDESVGHREPEGPDIEEEAFADAMDEEVRRVTGPEAKSIAEMAAVLVGEGSEEVWRRIRIGQARRVVALAAAPRRLDRQLVARTRVRRPRPPRRRLSRGRATRRARARSPGREPARCSRLGPAVRARGSFCQRSGARGAPA